MLLSLKWLREFVPVEAGAQEVGYRLTMLGLELEDIIHPYDAIKDIVVGHVLTKEAHPDSDHLHVTTVDVGAPEPWRIVWETARILTLCSASRAQTAAVMPTLSRPMTVTMAFIEDFLSTVNFEECGETGEEKAAARRGRRQALLLSSARPE